MYYQHICGLFFGKNAEHRRGVIENLYLLYLLQSFDAAVRTSPCLLRNRRGNRPGVGRTCAEVDQPEGGARSGGHHDGDDGGDHDYDGDRDDVGGDYGGNYGGDDEKYEREMSPKAQRTKFSDFVKTSNIADISHYRHNARVSRLERCPHHKISNVLPTQVKIFVCAFYLSWFLQECIVYHDVDEVHKNAVSCSRYYL